MARRGFWGTAMDDKAIQETLRKGQEALDRSKKLLQKINEGEERNHNLLEQFQSQLRDDPFRKKLEEAASSILDRIIEKNRPAAKAGLPAPVSIPEKLPPKKRDFSKHFDDAKLPVRQREAASLKYEHELSTADIAKRMNITRTAADKLIIKAKNRMDRIGQKQKASRQRAARRSSDDM
jgi:predicted DNA-binding protein YlxM (UPF0122 family)